MLIQLLTWLTFQLLHQRSPFPRVFQRHPCQIWNALKPCRHSQLNKTRSLEVKPLATRVYARRKCAIFPIASPKTEDITCMPLVSPECACVCVCARVCVRARVQARASARQATAYARTVSTESANHRMWVKFEIIAVCTIGGRVSGLTRAVWHGVDEFARLLLYYRPLIVRLRLPRKIDISYFFSISPSGGCP